MFLKLEQKLEKSCHLFPEKCAASFEGPLTAF